MIFFKNIFARIWALWGVVTFIATFCIIFIPSVFCYLLPEIPGQKLFRNISRIWMNVWLRIICCPVTVKGQKNFRKGQTYIVVCNHNALLDVPLSSPFIPGPNKTIAKKSFAKIPLFGLYYSKGSVLVDRKSDTSRRRSFEEMKKVLRTGMHVCIYPEGTRNRTSEPLKNFYAGAFKLSVETGTPVIPALIFNTKKAMPINKFFYLLPCRLRLEFLSEISGNHISPEDLKNKVFKEMRDYYEAGK
jgi:1-acyl-sn-glycerol-3-phosphate acyltransferase